MNSQVAQLLYTIKLDTSDEIENVNIQLYSDRVKVFSVRNGCFVRFCEDDAEPRTLHYYDTKRSYALATGELIFYPKKNNNDILINFEIYYSEFVNKIAYSNTIVILKMNFKSIKYEIDYIS